MDGSGFLYYSPDPQGLQHKQHGHHGHFLPYVAPSPQLLAPTPIPFPSQLVLGGRGIPLSITPFTSPSLMESYGSHDTCSESATSDMYLNPATPPLTHSGLSTPSLPYAMHTPISNHGWSSLDEPTITTVAPYEVQLASTPMEYMSGLLLPSNVIKSSASPAPSICLNDIHCPALSPCSSQASFTSEIDFCDPRNLLVQSPTPVDCNPALIFPPMSAVKTEETDQFIFGQDLEQFLPLAAVATKPYMTGDYNDELSDLECSEDEFIQSFEESVFTHPSKRVKYESDSENEQLPSPPVSTSSTRQSSIAPKPTKQRKSIKKRKDSSDSSSSDMSEEERLRSFKFGGCEDHDHDHDDDDEDSVESPCDRSSGIPINPHVIRRGRKQSLTEDPSKTFVCHLCNRRFRRQEHLKRHFRSLHTEDKPFSCGECGKKFSRSDNLTQHSRIHGTGSVVLGVLTEDEVSGGISDYDHTEDLSSLHMQAPELEMIVVNAITAASGESKDQKSSEDKKARRKRKRNEE